MYRTDLLISNYSNTKYVDLIIRIQIIPQSSRTGLCLHYVEQSVRIGQFSSFHTVKSSNCVMKMSEGYFYFKKTVNLFIPQET